VTGINRRSPPGAAAVRRPALRRDAVTHYLHRPLFADLLAALQPDGVLIYETFADGNAVFGRPAREFLLPGELLERMHGLRVVAFEQGQVAEPFPAVIQRICATGLETALAAPLPL
jgi:hypothetical protein